jgi:hypothetical protein
LEVVQDSADHIQPEKEAFQVLIAFIYPSSVED